MKPSRGKPEKLRALTDDPAISGFEASEVLEVGMRDGVMTFVLLRKDSASDSKNVRADDAMRFSLPAAAVDKMLSMLVKLHGGMGLNASTPKGSA